MKQGLTLFALMCVSSFVAGAQSLSLEECRSKALAHYPEVAQYDLINQSEQYNLCSAARSWIPQISFSGQASWQSAAPTFPEELRTMMLAQGIDLQGIPQDQYKLAIDVQQTLYDGGASKAGKQLSSLQAGEQRLGTEVALSAVQQRVSSIYFSLLLLDEQYSISMGSEELLDANYKRLSSMQRNGLATQSDLDQVQVERIGLRQQMEQNRASRESFISMLELFIGEPLGGRSLELPQPPPRLPDEFKTPEIRLLDAQIKTLDARESLLSTGVTPVVSFFAQGYYGNPGLDMFQAMLSRDWTWNAYVGLRMQWNISALFTYGADKRQVETERSRLRVKKDVAAFNTTLHNKQLGDEIQRMQAALESDEEIVHLRTRIRQSAESQRESGVIDTATLLRRISEEGAALGTRSLHEIELRKTQYEHYYLSK